MKSPFISFVLSLASVLAATASDSLPRIQPGGITPDWESLKDLRNVQAGVVAAGEPVTMERMADAYLERADDLYALRIRDAEGVDVTEAKRLEVLALLFAGWSGDTSRDVDRDAAVADVRADESIAPELRNEVAAYAENLKVNRREFTTRKERLLAFEEKARLLQAEFPGVADNYEALLQLARSQDDANGERIVNDLLRLPAPDWVLSAAEGLKSRYGLIGQNLAELATLPAPAQDALAKAQGGEVLIYTWSTASKASIAAAGALDASVKAEIILLGVNLDEDTVVARSVAAEAGLRGEQIHADTAGAEEWAAALQLSRPGLVYAIGPAGVITSVSGHARIKPRAREEQP